MSVNDLLAGKMYFPSKPGTQELHFLYKPGFTVKLIFSSRLGILARVLTHGKGFFIIIKALPDKSTREYKITKREPGKQIMH